MSKFFGWKNTYHFNLHENGPYSIKLSNDYTNLKFIKNYGELIHNLNLEKFNSFLENSNTKILEAEATLFYYNIIHVKINENDALNILNSIKPHIPRNAILFAYNKLMNFNLFNLVLKNNTNNDLNDFEVLIKINLGG